MHPHSLTDGGMHLFLVVSLIAIKLCEHLKYISNGEIETLIISTESENIEFKIKNY